MSKTEAETQTLALAELVEDMDLYPRHAVDPTHVQSLVFALESGANLPPIVVDAKSRRITDGWHRCRAYRRFLGNQASVDVLSVHYQNEQEMIFDAVHRNAEHGRRLDSIDRTRSAIMLEHAGFSGDQIGLALHVPTARVEKLLVKVAVVPRGNAQAVPGTSKVTLKRSVAHLSGTKLTKSQAAAHASLPGTSFLLIAKQLSLGLRERMVNLEDAKLVEQLTELRDLLAGSLP